MAADRVVVVIPTAAAVRRTSPLAAFGARDFRIFWPGLLGANVATGMQAFGLGWLTVQLAVRDGTPERGPLYLGLVGFSRAVPAVGLGLFGGVIADRRDRRLLLLLTQAGFAAVALAFAALTLTNQISLLWVLILSALMSVMTAFYIPAREAIQPRLVGEHNLMSAFGLNSLAVNIGSLAGPLLGGLLIVPFGIGQVLLGAIPR